jgi:REP element-mobilizing transposase RayT
VKVRPDVPSLRDGRLVRELERSFARACDRGDFRLAHYSIQSNHLHLIVEARDAQALGRGMKALGSRLARAVNQVFGRRGPVLLDRFHHVVLKTPTQVRNALRYVLLNARRHARSGRTGRSGRSGGKTAPASRAARGQALGVQIDPASSGRWFDGWRLSAQALVARARARPGAAVCAIAAPRSWLLDTGWRRAGPRLDPGEPI